MNISLNYAVNLLQGLFGLLLLVYIPRLDPYLGYSPVQTESADKDEYEELPAGEYVCPERHVNIFSSTCLLSPLHRSFILIAYSFVKIVAYAFTNHISHT